MCRSTEPTSRNSAYPDEQGREGGFSTPRRANTKKASYRTTMSHHRSRRLMTVTPQSIIFVLLASCIMVYAAVLFRMTQLIPAAERTKRIAEVRVRPSQNKNSILAQEAKNLRAEVMAAANSTAFEGDIVHIVQTRFQQNQGKLKHLAQARAELFRTFCLPTMVQQTNQNFLWIIRTDERMNEGVLESMKEMLRPHPNYILLTSNKRRNDTLPFSDIGESGDLLNATKVVSGDASLAKLYFQAAQSKVILETRLDADDGLNLNFLDYLQTSTKSRFFEDDELKDDADWVYWCADHHFEWYSDANKLWGELNFSREAYCITPGLTLAYRPQFDLAQVPHKAHFLLHKKVGPCLDESDAQCLKHLANMRPGAIRARTPTSAGMKNVQAKDPTDDSNDNKVKSKMDELNTLRWEVLNKLLGITVLSAAEVNQHLQKNLVEIAKDNLKGQCSMGHSCKKEAKERLRALIDATYVPNITRKEEGLPSELQDKFAKSS